MKNYIIVSVLIIVPFFLSNKTRENKKTHLVVRDNWSGTVTWSKSSVSRGAKTWEEAGKENSAEWDNFFEFKVIATFVNGKGTVVRTEVTTNKGKQKLIFVHKDDKYMIEEKTTKITCGGTDTLELSVEYGEDTTGRKVYWISFSTPDCVGEILYNLTNNITGDVHNRTAYTQQGSQITLPASFTGQPVGNNPNVLSGSFLETIPGSPDAGGGEIVTTASWNLTKGDPKPELLVTPISDDADYDNWMPEPGLNESVKGNDLNIELHLQDIGGGVSSVKAKFFELKLVNTSKEKGVCINAPLAPSAPKPDLRFLPQAGATVSPDGQYIKIPCEDGENGLAVIGSYDGGGWTILTAKATLENGKTVEGVLDRDKSKKNIPIPKNFSGGKIAEAWLKDNGNPGETDDKETSQENTNNGDGLSAYEEYRGVMSEGKFKRLDPLAKELGVKFKKTQLSLFDDGFHMFEKVSGFKIIQFYENEIPASRRINGNAAHANVFPQFVLNLQTGILTEKRIAKSFGSPGIPTVVSPVMFDLAKIHQAYVENESDARSMNTSLPYTERDFLAQIVAHEIGHGVNVAHHGSIEPTDISSMVVDTSQAPPFGMPRYRVIRYNGREVTYPVTIGGTFGLPHNAESGDLSCIMAEINLCSWVEHVQSGVSFLYEVPIIPLGVRLCTFRDGTGINAGGKYFADAQKGDCISQLKLK